MLATGPPRGAIETRVVFLCVPYAPARRYRSKPYARRVIFAATAHHAPGAIEMPRDLVEADDASRAPVHAGLLDFAGEVAGAHVLVLGSGALPVLCGLIRRGASGAAEAGLDERATVDPAELIVVPRVASPGQAAQAIAIARRALLPCGRIVLRAVSAGLAREIADRLRASGFVAIRARVDKDGPIIIAERPLFGAAMSVARA